jgi:hypothetical protein
MLNARKQLAELVGLRTYALSLKSRPLVLWQELVVPTGDPPEAAAAVHRHQPEGIDKSRLAIPPPTLLSQDAPSLCRPTTCLFCVANRPTRIILQPRALGRKASDELSVPLSNSPSIGTRANEAAWWKGAGIDPRSCSQS